MAAQDYAAKSITDPIYGYVGLSALEADVASSQVFQRLHNVRQLGLAYLVFPSAGYSRFAHSVGACHNAGRLLDAIEANSSREFSKEERQAYRLAALLHDVGHYPFSHATEHAIQGYYASSLLEGGGDEEDGTGLNHEDVGGVIIETDPGLDGIFRKHGFSKQSLRSIFSKQDPDALVGIISSDLDCDRMDYLRRTAHLSGAPYGSVDTDFIISKATVDKDGILCFQDKATMAIDHLLVSRFYDYTQVAFHKTVAALEWSLVECIRHLLNKGKLKLSASDVTGLIQNGEWANIDDNRMLGIFKNEKMDLGNRAGTAVICDHLGAVLYRRPAKLVWQWQQIARSNDTQIKTQIRLARNAVATVVSEMGIDQRRFQIADRAFPISKVSSTVDDGELSYGEQARAVSILPFGKRKARLLVNRRECLLHDLSESSHFSVKVFYLPQASEEKSTRDKIRGRMRELCED
jgi:HD superfamily phosphohydrolase